MPYAVEVARPVYRRTEAYGEGFGLEDAVEAAWHAARRTGPDRVEVIRGDAFVAAILKDGKSIPVPHERTEHHHLKWAGELERFEQAKHLPGGEVGYDGTFRVRAGCAERSYECTTVCVDVAPRDPAWPRRS